MRREYKSSDLIRFRSTDILAAGAINYCIAEGIAALGDVSVMGFDNLGIAELTSPELATLWQRRKPASVLRSSGRTFHSALLRLK